MRKVNKEARPIPPKLLACFKDIEGKLLEKKEKHRFDNACYNAAIKADLKTLYYNKCAFCETILNDIAKDPCQFTVEHFRPKEQYYWLGYEWTNLLPCCNTCNNGRGTDFPLPDKRKKVLEAPIVKDEQGNIMLDLDQCRADHPILLDEKPNLLHPEIDDPMQFLQFSVDQIGHFIDSTDIGDLRSHDTIRTYKLNRTILAIEKRKRLYDDLMNNLQSQMMELVETRSLNYDNSDLRIAFNGIFKQLYRNANNQATEYYSFWVFLLINFDTLFIQKMPDKKYQVILNEAFANYLNTTLTQPPH
jgi:uncharacterized protein (TIGR02646 family)